MIGRWRRGAGRQAQGGDERIVIDGLAKTTGGRGRGRILMTIAVFFCLYGAIAGRMVGALVGNMLDRSLTATPGKDVEGPRRRLDRAQQAHEPRARGELRARDAIVGVDVVLGDDPALPRGVGPRVLDLPHDRPLVVGHAVLLRRLPRIDGRSHHHTSPPTASTPAPSRPVRRAGPGVRDTRRVRPADRTRSGTRPLAPAVAHRCSLGPVPWHVVCLESIAASGVKAADRSAGFARLSSSSRQRPLRAA